MAAEIFVVTPAIRSLIFANTTKCTRSTRPCSSSKKHGMQTMNDALYQLYMAREVDEEECPCASPATPPSFTA